MSLVHCYIFIFGHVTFKSAVCIVTFIGSVVITNKISKHVLCIWHYLEIWYMENCIQN